MYFAGKCRFITRVLLVFAIFFLVSVVCEAVGVSPMVIDQDLRPGQNGEFEFQLLPSSQTEQVDLNLYQPVQLLDGGMTYLEPDPDSFPAVNWVNLETNSISVPPGDRVKVKGTVSTPFGAGGSHTVIIMVEPQTATTRSGISLRFRYAVRLNIRVNQPGLPYKAELNQDWGLVKGDDGLPQIEASFKNTSAWDYLVNGEAVIRDESGVMVERVDMVSPIALKSGSKETRIYPGSTVRHLGKVTRRLYPGKYNIRLFFHYGDYGQLVGSKDITVEEGDFDYPEIDNAGMFSIEPVSQDLTLRPGQRKTVAFELRNQAEGSLQIKIDTAEITNDYQHSLLDWVTVRSKKEFGLVPHLHARSIVSFAPPRDITAGSYHGYLVLKAYQKDEKDPITEKRVLLSVLIEGNNYYSLKLNDFNTKLVGDQNWATLQLYNNGDTFIQPTAEVVIKDQQGQQVGKVALNMIGDLDRILPRQYAQMTGTLPKLENGDYRAEITVKRDSEVLVEKVETLTIEQ